MEKRGTTVCYTLQDPGGKQARRPNIPQTLPKNLAMHSYKFSLLKAAFPLLKEIEVFIQYYFLSLSDCMTSLNMSPCKTKNCTPTNMSKLNWHPRANVKFSTLPKPYTHRAWAPELKYLKNVLNLTLHAPEKCLIACIIHRLPTQDTLKAAIWNQCVHKSFFACMVYLR